MRKNRLLHIPILIVLGIVALTISSKVSLDLQPVPITFQSAVVMLLGIILGGRLGALTVLIWLVIAGLGFEVLSGSKSGLGALTGQSAGYLFAFVATAYLAGQLPVSRQFGAVITRFGGAILLHLLILAIGAGWLSVFVGIDTAIRNGFLPFIFGGLVKSVIVAAVPAFLPKRPDLRY